VFAAAFIGLAARFHAAARIRRAISPRHDVIIAFAGVARTAIPFRRT